ncbi:MAG: hypothetical protein WBM37_12395, partial [Nitrososphaeraceae archaeon]
MADYIQNVYVKQQYMIKSNSDDDSIMMTMIDNDDVFLNLNNYPNPIAAFNSIMRQYYDIEGNPIQRRHQQTNENREIVSSVQSTNTRTRTSEKKVAFTLDILLP